MLDSIINSSYGIYVLGIIGSIIAIFLFKMVLGASERESHEVHVFMLLFNKTNSQRDETDHVYLIILSCTFTLGMLLLTCTSVLAFQLIRLNSPEAYYSLVAVFVAAVTCLYGVIKGIHSINHLLDINLQRREGDAKPQPSESSKQSDPLGAPQGD